MSDSDESAEPVDSNEDVSEDTSATPDAAAVEAKTPQFDEVPVTSATSGTTLERFRDVSVSISAELGRVSMPLGELLKIGEGAVVKLDRPVSAPVELLAQGVRVALGEVVVVDDCFAVRIREIDSAGGGAG
jgi:flagellar motor switch protein FliN/FliY